MASMQAAVPGKLTSPYPRIKSYGRIREVLPVPNLIRLQIDSYRWFQDVGLQELLEEVSPIQDFTGTRMELRFVREIYPGREGKHASEYVGLYPVADVKVGGRLLASAGKPLTAEAVAEIEERNLGDGEGLGLIPVRPYYFKEPKCSEDECRRRDQTYSVPLHVNVQLVIKESGEVKEQELFMGDFPLMTDNGTFIVNGAERVVVSQLVRSPGVYFTLTRDATSGRELCSAKLIPNRGAWLEFETSNRNVISVKVDRKRKIPITTLLRAVGYGSDEEIFPLFADIDNHPDHRYIDSTIARDPLQPAESLKAAEAEGLWASVRPQDRYNEAGARWIAAGLLDFYRRMRPGDPPTLDNARGLLNSLFFNARRYDLGKVGRYKLNKRLGLPDSVEKRTLDRRDLVEIVRQLIRVNNGVSPADDIDHLGNRRVRSVGELVQNQFRIGLLRMERVVRERMTITDPEQATPSTLVNVRPVVAAMKEFFGGSQLSQFMDQTNPLAELAHKRRLSALGPGGLSRERAGFDVRDVHHSHYGRVCPIETPEGPNIGLIGALATYARINEYGFIETPYREVWRELPSGDQRLVGRVLRQPVVAPDGEVIIEEGAEITPELFKQLKEMGERTVYVVPYVSDNIVYLSADREEDYVVAQANVVLDEKSHFVEPRMEARFGSRFVMEAPEHVDYVDVSPKQVVSVATSLIPFLEHDDANRALMGANMQRQAVPVLRPEAPLVATGMEVQAGHDSGQVLFALNAGEVVAVSADRISVRESDGGVRNYRLRKFVRSNQGTCINQRPIVATGQWVEAGETLADSASSDQGELALGQSVLCAFMMWEGYNFEDAIILSESVAREDKFTSIHIEKHEVEARDTKLGPEEITRDIPNVGEESLHNLDEEGIIRKGAEVGTGDILVGKITPKGETELTAEEKLLRAIFGEKAREVKDTSLRVPHGERGKVIDVQVFSRDQHDELPAGVNKLVRVSIAQKRKISVGDKMAGRHGNKGVISRILPVEDMPYLSDGRPIEIILNPIGVPGRMNVGQVLETHLGWAAEALGFRVISPVFEGAREEAIEDALAKAWLIQRASGGRNGGNGANGHDSHLTERLQHAREWVAERGYDPDQVLADEAGGAARRACLDIWLQDVGIDPRSIEEGHEGEVLARLEKELGLVAPITGKSVLYDGRTGAPFDRPVTVGQIYMMKLVHLVEDKVHARSTGPYSLITQQPLGGKAQVGGQRFGEMEVWALEAHGAAHILQELLTVKSDDVVGRVKTYEAIVKGENALEPGVPESFKVLVKELQSLGLAVEVLNEEQERVVFAEDGLEVPELGIDLTGPEKGEEF